MIEKLRRKTEGILVKQRQQLFRLSQPREVRTDTIQTTIRACPRGKREPIRDTRLNENRKKVSETRTARRESKKTMSDKRDMEKRNAGREKIR